MKSSNRISNKLFGGLFAALFGILSISAAQAQIYVGKGAGAQAVSEYNSDGSTVSTSLIADLPTGGVSIAQVGSDLYIASTGYGNESDGVVGVYTTSGAPVNASLITGLGSPDSIVVSGSYIYVGNTETGTVGKYTLSGAPINTSLITGLNGPTALAVSGGNLYVATDSYIGEYTTSGAAVNATLINTDTYIGGIAVSGSDLYFTNYESGAFGYEPQITPGSVSEYTTSGTLVNAAVISGYGINSLSGIAISGSDLYVTNEGTGTIGEFTLSGGDVNPALVYSPGSFPRSIVVIPQAAPIPPVAPASATTPVSTGASYSSVTPVTASGGLGTTVSLVGGKASTGQTVTLATTNIGANFKSLASDVVSVTGNAGDVFTVQLTFDLNAANQIGGADAVRLLWLNPATGLWENVVDGNTGTNTTNPNFLDYQGSFASFEAANSIDDANLSLALGAYGVDTTNDTVWAVINHNSDFGAGDPMDPPTETPEPSTWAMLAFGAFGLYTYGRMRTNRRFLSSEKTNTVV